ncbi:metallophosphoesterase [Nocardioides sp.]|uniref:metallophosphoesterase n=1 Tax=Nocardioides sp. TaxID=35761 RepID=UPI003565AB89
MQYGQFPAPRFTIAHLSDVHLLSEGRKQYDAIVPEDGLRLAIARLRRLDPVPDALVFSGDLADKGEPAAYARIRELVEPVAAEMGAQVVWVMGNHDDRAPYAAELFDRDHGDTAADDIPAQDAVHDVRGLRIISLDTSVPTYHHGELTDDQLAWLSEVLATPAEHGTVLALHHPPIPVPMLPPAGIIELLEMDRLAAVIEGTDVRIILGGHYHYTTHSTFAGIPVSVASAGCYTVDVAPVDRLISGVDGHQAFNMVHVYDDRVVNTVVPLAQAPEVSGFGSEMAELLEAMTPQERTETISRKDSDFNLGVEGPLMDP